MSDRIFTIAYLFYLLIKNTYFCTQMTNNLIKQIRVFFIFAFAIAIFASRIPLPMCRGPKYGSQDFPISLQEVQTFRMDELFTGYNLNFSIPNQPNFVQLRPKLSEIDSLLRDMDGLHAYHYEKQGIDNKASLITISNKEEMVYLSWGSSISQSTIPDLTNKIVLNTQDIQCYDAVWLKSQGLIVVDCAKTVFYGLENVFYYVDTSKLQVTAQVVNPVYADLSTISSRRLVLIQQDGVNLLVRAYLSSNFDSHLSQNTYLQLISLYNPLKPRSIDLIDRSALHQDKLTITDIEVYQGSIYLLDYYSGVIKVEINSKQLLDVSGRYRTGKGYTKLGVSYNPIRSKLLLALAHNNSIVEVDWSDQDQPQIIGKYSIPDNSDIAELWVNQQNIVVQLTANLTNQRYQVKQYQSTYVLNKGSRTYTSSSLSIPHPSKAFVVLNSQTNQLLIIDTLGVKLYAVSSPLMAVNPLEPSLLNKQISFIVKAVSTNQYSGESLICACQFKFTIVEPDSMLLWPTGETLPRDLYVNYPGRLSIPIGRYVLGQNITFSLMYNETQPFPSFYFLQQNDTDINWYNHQQVDPDYVFLKTQYDRTGEPTQFRLYTQDSNNLTLFSRCAVLPFTSQVHCFANTVYHVNHRISMLAASRFKYLRSKYVHLAALVFSSFPNQVFLYDVENDAVMSVPPIIFEQGPEGVISGVEFLNQYLVVVLPHSKRVVLFDMIQCQDNLPRPCRQTYSLDINMMARYGVDYYSPRGVVLSNLYPSALFIQCLDRIIVMDISANGPVFLSQVQNPSPGNQQWKMVVVGSSLIVASAPSTVLEYDLSDLYTARQIVLARRYPCYSYQIPLTFSLESSGAGNMIYITACDTELPKDKCAMVLVYRVGMPAASAFYDQFSINAANLQGVMISVAGNSKIGDYITVVRGSALTIFRQYQNPTLIFQNVFGDFKFNLTFTNDKLSRYYYLSQSTIHTANYPENIIINNTDINKTEFLSIPLDISKDEDCFIFDDSTWFNGSVLNFTLDGCQDCNGKVKIRNHIEVDKIVEGTNAMYDYTYSQDGGYIQGYNFIMRMMSNGSISQFAWIPSGNPGQVCTSIDYNQLYSYIISACQTGQQINLYLTSNTASKPFIIDSYSSAAQHVTKLQVVQDLIFLVDTEQSFGSFMHGGAVFVYALGQDIQNNGILEEVQIIDSDDLIAANGWEGGECFIANAHVSYQETSEIYRMVLTEQRNGVFVVDFKWAKGRQAVQILQVTFINLAQQLIIIGLPLPNQAYFSAVAINKETYDEQFRSWEMEIIVATSNFHSFLLTLHIDRAGIIVGQKISRVFYRYGFYSSTNYLKAFNGYFAISQELPPYMEAYPQYSRLVLTVYDTRQNRISNQISHKTEKVENQLKDSKVPVSYLLAGYTMQKGIIRFDWKINSLGDNSDDIGIVVLHYYSEKIMEMKVNSKLRITTEEFIEKNQNGYLIARNDFDKMKLPISLIRNFGKATDIPHEYEHQRVAFSPDYSQVYTYGPKTNRVASHSYQQWNKRSVFRLEAAPAYIEFAKINNTLGFIFITTDGMIRWYKNLMQMYGIPLLKEPLSGTIKRLIVSPDGGHYAAAFQNSSLLYVGLLQAQSTPKVYDFTKYGSLNNIRWRPKTSKLMISAGTSSGSNHYSEEQSPYLGQLDLESNTFTDYSLIIQYKIVDMDFSADGSTLYYVQQIGEAEDVEIKVYTFALQSLDKAEYINSTFFSQWSQVTMIELREQLLLVKSQQKAKVCSQYSWGVYCFDNNDQLLGGTLSPDGSEWVSYETFGLTAGVPQNFYTTRYCGLSKYYSTLQNTCKSCIESCSTCLFNSTFCSSCFDGFFLSQNHTCQPCSDNCQFCRDQTACECKEKYYLQADQCLLCSEAILGCYTCDSSTQCRLCYQSNYWQLKQGKCECMERYYQNEGHCENCPTFCLHCDSNTVCTTCDPATHRIPDSKGACVCDKGYILNSGVCQTCSSYMPGCLTCSSIDVCQSCDKQAHFSLSKDKCICEGGYIQENKVCSLCSSYMVGCLNCSRTDRCQTCDSRKHFIVTDTNKCKCQANYGLNQSTCQLCSSTIPGCLTCKDLDTCLTCDQSTHFQLNGTSCSCLQGYTLSAGICHLCSQFIEHCSTCQSATICSACEEEFELSGNSCSKSSSATMWIIIGVVGGVVIAGVIVFLIYRRVRKVKKESLLTNQSGSQIIKDSEKIGEETES